MGKYAFYFTDVVSIKVSSMNIKQDDVVIGISNSGRTRPTVDALKYAKEKGIKTILLSLLTFLATKSIKNVSKTAEKRTPFKKLLKNKELLTMDIVAIIHGVMKENISLWIAVYIADIYRVDLTKSSLRLILKSIFNLKSKTTPIPHTVPELFLIFYFISNTENTPTNIPII